MTTVVIVVVVVIVLALLAVAGAAIARRRRSQQLRQQFGPEYDEVLARSGNRKEAEQTLQQRRERHDELHLRSLDPATRDRFRDDWVQVQRSFVDDPAGAVEHADGLVTTIMRERGYPIEDFEQRAADISVAHPRVVEHYREARRVHDAQRDGTAGTEDLRGAVTSYRSLVEALLDDQDDEDRRHDGAPRGGGRGVSEQGTGERGGPDRGAPGRHGAQAPGPDEAAPGGRRDGSRR